MQFDLAIRGGRIATSQAVVEADIGISGDKIVAIGSLGDAPAAETIDARHLVVLPGLIDTQVHFREPGMEHKEDIESGTRAAIYGGVTTVLEMPNTNPPTTSKEALADKLERAAGRAWCDYGFFVGATSENYEEAEELEMLPGSPGLKIFMGSSTGALLLDSEEHLRAVLRNGARRISIHAEDEARLRERKALIKEGDPPSKHPFWRDPESALIATTRVLAASEESGRPVHILHVSTKEEVDALRKAKVQDGRVSCEVTPQHLYFDAPACYERLGTKAQMNPPIRSKEHQEALWRAVGEGLFDVFGSDHAPHTVAEKAKTYPGSPSGMPGVQTMLPVLMTFVSQGRLRLQDLSRMCSEIPSRLFGIREKGMLCERCDADLVLVDPARTQILDQSLIQSKCGWSPFEGEKLTGWPVQVLLRGHTVLRDGELVGQPGGRSARYNWKG